MVNWRYGLAQAQPKQLSTGGLTGGMAGRGHKEMPRMNADIPSHASMVPRPDCAALPIGAAHRRSRRVLVLLIAIVALSGADLAATIAHQPIGMIESNPLAQYIIETTQSTSALAAFKMATVLVCVGLLYKLRCCRQGEVAAWTAVVILIALTVWWGVASDHLTRTEAVSQHMLEQAASQTEANRIVALPTP